MADRIDALARRMCENLGLDPDEDAHHGYGDDMTPAERADALRDCIPDVALTSPRWHLYRPKAAEFLALSDALGSPAWRPIDTAPRDQWVLVRGGRFDGYFERLHDGSEPPAVVAKYDDEDEWRFANYDAGEYGCYIAPTEWAPLPSSSRQLKTPAAN